MEEEFMVVNIAPKEVTPMVINGQVTADYSRYDIVSTFPNFMSVNNLQVIRMPTTDLEYIPEEFCNMKCLKELSLFGDGIRQSGLTFLPEKFANLKSLQVLNLEQNQFKNFPLQICELINLEKLYLNACGLTVVPQRIINLVHLSDIDLSSNDLSLNGLPNEFFQLPKLKQLYLNDCQLKTLPSDIGHLRTLEGLQLNDNFLKTFPDELYSLRHLKKISAKNNCLICLSSRIIELQSLEKLLLMENNITVLPAEIAKLPNLQFVNVFDNKLTRLPESLTDLGPTTRIVVRGNNHLQMPPLDVCNKGMNSIRGFFESMKKSRPVHSKRIKLVLLGESGAGKTSCAHGLVECEAINQTLNDGTVGVVIRNWQVEPDGLEVQVVDCAGQRRYQLTHPFFLSEEALHLLVINLHSYKKTPESFERNAGDWIKWVTSRLEKPRIMVVLTHRDECREDEITDKCSDILKGIKSLESHEVRRLKMEMEAIKKKGKDKDVDRKVEQLKWQIKNRPIISSVLLNKSEICYKEISDNKSGWLGMVAVSNMHELEGMMQLRQEIIRASKDMSLFPSVGRDLPESWVKLELAIKEFRSSVKAPNVPCMTVGQFNKFALDKSGLSGIGLLSALHYFESVGELKYYSGMPPAEFCVFLDLPWLGKLVKLLFRHDYEENLMFSDSYFKFDMEKIMFDHSVTKLKRDGVLSLQLLRCIWNEMSFDNDTFNQMVNAFLHFGLACRLPSPVDDEPCLFIPWFLHSGSRPQDWKDCPDDDEDEIRLLFAVCGYLPQGLFDRLRIRCFYHSTDADNWEDGMLIHVGDGLKILVQMADGPGILICGRGPKNTIKDLWKELLQIIRETEALLREWSRLVYHTYTVCPVCIRNKVPEPGHYRCDWLTGTKLSRHCSKSRRAHKADVTFLVPPAEAYEGRITPIDESVPEAMLSSLSAHLPLDWRPLGTELRFSQDQLDVIDSNHSDVREKANRMLQDWRRREGARARRSTLVVGLRAIERGDLIPLLQHYEDNP